MTGARLSAANQRIGQTAVKMVMDYVAESAPDALANLMTSPAPSWPRPEAMLWRGRDDAPLDTGQGAILVHMLPQGDRVHARSALRFC